ncbi:hypothetical protein MRX96_029093 [Rhipicephalus microplus]
MGPLLYGLGLRATRSEPLLLACSAVVVPWLRDQEGRSEPNKTSFAAPSRHVYPAEIAVLGPRNVFLPWQSSSLAWSGFCCGGGTPDEEDTVSEHGRHGPCSGAFSVYSMLTLSASKEMAWPAAL